MTKPKTNFAVTPAAGYLLYRAYKSGKFDSLKDKIFHNPKFSIPGLNKEESAEDHSHFVDTINEADSSITIEKADTIHGAPAQNIEFDPSVYQFYDDTCAIQSQNLILKQYGIDVSQEELVQIAKDNGWYAEGYGTPMCMVGKLLEYFGINVQGSLDNNIFNLVNELAQGHQVIVGVDEYELVNPYDPRGWDFLHGDNANHALVVVGVDTSDPDNVSVIVTDPGTGNKQMAYPAEQFIDAWKDSHCFMVSTESVPTYPKWCFNHIDNFAGIPTDSIARLADMDINIDSIDTYNSFVDELLANPNSFDSLLDQYADLFDFSSDDE